MLSLFIYVIGCLLNVVLFSAAYGTEKDEELRKEYDAESFFYGTLLSWVLLLVVVGMYLGMKASDEK
jgi:hypothetical protein